MAGKNPCKGCEAMHTDLCPTHICPSCFKGGSYYRKKTGDYRCPYCGSVWSKSFSELMPVLEPEPAEKEVDSLKVLVHLNAPAMKYVQIWKKAIDYPEDGNAIKNIVLRHCNGIDETDPKERFNIGHVIPKKPFEFWTVEDKVCFLHEVLDHFNRVQSLGIDMLVQVNYHEDDRFETGFPMPG